MVFRKKKKVEEERREELVTIPEDDMMDDNPNEVPTAMGLQQPIQNPLAFPQSTQLLQSQPQAAQQPQPQVQPTQPVQDPQTQTGSARIISGELVEIGENTFHRYIILSNKSIGSVGEEFPIE